MVITEGGTQISSFDRTLPRGLDYLKAEFACEVKNSSLTIRILVNGEQLNDGDIPIPQSQKELQRSTFFCTPVRARRLRAHHSLKTRVGTNNRIIRIIPISNNWKIIRIIRILFEQIIF